MLYFSHSLPSLCFLCFTSSQIIEEVTEIEPDEIKMEYKTKSATDLSTKEIANLNEIGISENIFLIRGRE